MQCKLLFFAFLVLCGTLWLSGLNFGLGITLLPSTLLWPCTALHLLKTLCKITVLKCLANISLQKLIDIYMRAQNFSFLCSSLGLVHAQVQGWQGDPPCSSARAYLLVSIIKLAMPASHPTYGLRRDIGAQGNKIDQLNSRLLIVRTWSMPIPLFSL
jgi:hypothetical protein